MAKNALRWKALRAAAIATDRVLSAAARAGRALPVAHPRLHGVKVERNVPYHSSGDRAHLLDVYRPIAAQGPLPIVLYVHGGAFSILSKDSHWMLALIFARRGFLVFNINYRLSPRHPFPAATQDTCTAYRWIVDNAARYGGDLDRIVLAGDSAGGNLAAGLALACCYKRDEPWARSVWNTKITPKVVVPASAILQVSDAGRFGRRRKLQPGVANILYAVGRSYLRLAPGNGAHSLDLANPLLVIEQGRPPDRALPAFFLSVGTRDPLLDDVRRFEAALRNLNVSVEARYYEGQMHLFHAFVWRRVARACWRDTFAFIDQNMANAETHQWVG